MASQHFQTLALPSLLLLLPPPTCVFLKCHVGMCRPSSGEVSRGMLLSFSALVFSAVLN